MCDKWKIQLTIANNFISYIANDQEHVMQGDNMEIVINDEPDEVIKKLLIDLKKDIKII